jgi:ferric-dicitrate binding protein FerR (iron transport regulator)
MANVARARRDQRHSMRARIESILSHVDDTECQDMRMQKIDARRIALRFQALPPAVLLLLVAASAPATPSARGHADSRVYVTAVSGQVDVTMAGETVIVERDSTMLLPARIVTGHDGMLDLAQAGTTISVSTDTDIEIPAEAVDGNLVARLVQHRGNVFYDVAPRDVGKLRVETPFLVAVIKGTQFNVAVQQDGTTISLFEGSLELRTPDGSDLLELNAGEIAIRSLLDDSIRIIGMNDERAAAPRAPEPVAADAAQAAAPGGYPESESVTPANAPAIAVDRLDVESTVAGNAVEVATRNRPSRDQGPSVVALERRNDPAGGRSPALDVALDRVDLGLGGDAGLDASVDLDGGIDESVFALPDAADAGLDVGGAIDLGPDLVVPDVGPLGLDGGGPPGLDGAGPPGLDIDIGAGTVDLARPDRGPKPRVKPSALGLL